MKKFIYVLMACVLSMFVASCGGNSKSTETDRIAQLEDSIAKLSSQYKGNKENIESQSPNSFENEEVVADQEKIKKERQEKIDREGFYTSSGGPYSIEKVISMMYDNGIQEGKMDKMDGIEIYSYKHGHEYHFKGIVWQLGVPNNEKAKDVYDKAYKAYLKGYEEGYNF